MSTHPCLEIGAEVTVFDRYRFALPLRARVVNGPADDGGFEVELLASNNRSMPVGWRGWFFREQLTSAAGRTKHGWTCFFCGETFTTPGSAQDHFGAAQFGNAACQIKAGEERGLVMALRRAEAELASYRSEDSEKDRAMHRMQSDHHEALRRAEEEGYARGLRDARELRTEAPVDADACPRCGSPRNKGRGCADLFHGGPGE